MPSFSAFDARGYRTLAPREGYDRWAATYEETVEDAMDIALLGRLAVDWDAVGSGPGSSSPSSTSASSTTNGSP